MRITVRLVAIAGVIVASAVTAHAQTPRDAAACAMLTKLQIPGIALSITKAEWFPEGSSPPELPGLLLRALAPG